MTRLICNLPTELRSQILDVMSMWTLPSVADTQNKGDLEALTAQLNDVSLSCTLNWDTSLKPMRQRLFKVGMTEEGMKQEIDLAYVFAQLHVLDSVFTSGAEPRLVSDKQTHASE